MWLCWPASLNSSLEVDLVEVSLDILAGGVLGLALGGGVGVFGDEELLGGAVDWSCLDGPTLDSECCC